MRDSRQTRAMLITGISAALGAILGTHFLTPIVKKGVKSV